MPGAFVFDPADSVESAQTARTRPLALETAPPAPKPAPDVVAATQPVLSRHGRAIPRRPVRARHRLPAAVDQLAAPSEDSD
jgi:hypothetical protein